MLVKERDWRPRYVQLAEALRDQIDQGELAAGTAMPSETELASTSGLSRTSVRNSIRLLRDWGLIRAEQGRGTFVRAPRQRVRREAAKRYQWEKDRALIPVTERSKAGSAEQDTGLTVEDLTFHAEYHSIDADQDLASAFGLEIGTRLLQRRYWTTSRRESDPLSMSVSYLVHDLVAGNPALVDAANEPWPGGTQHQLMTVGIELDRIIDEVTARPPMPDEAQILGIEPGIAVIGMRKISIDTDGRVVEVADVVLPGDRTTLIYTTKLDRWPS